jgi:uncharacterized alpha/beta hydrolase family protein
MELAVQYNIDQILQAIKQLPVQELKVVKKVVDQSLNTEQINSNADLKELLLKGPVMTDQQYELFIENRKRMNQWRTL